MEFLIVVNIKIMVSGVVVHIIRSMNSGVLEDTITVL
jgi:hypothetical protein